MHILLTLPENCIIFDKLNFKVDKEYILEFIDCLLSVSKYVLSSTDQNQNNVT